MIYKFFSPRTLVLLFAAWTLSLALAACGAMSAAPETPQAPAAEPTSDVLSTPTPIFPMTGDFAQPAIPETRRLTLEYPSRVKAGAESDIVRLTLEVDDLGNITPTAEFEGNVVEGEVIEIPNLYESHTVTAEARFDIAGMQVEPPGATYQMLRQGESVTFYWSIRPQEVGTYRGTIWLHLVFVERSSGEESRMAVSAQIVEIEAVDFFGFSTNFVRTSGVVGSVLGVVVGFPFFKDIVNFVWGRFSKRRRKPGKTSRKI
ncbi:MAG TPA: hypothetical protein PK152_02460 [Anaerolineales bacterium]|nr:hypothetical protein [Anaerolineales bacterium]